jgi:Holliday junction DNA helicase RuvB
MASVKEKLTQTDIDALARMAAFEKTMSDRDKKLGWSWRDVKTYPATLSKLMLADLLNLTYDSNKHKNYMLLPTAYELLANAGAPAETAQPTQPPQLDVSGLFAEIIGYDSLKELLREVLLADDRVHVLMHGPPSVAKSLFLGDIEQATGDMTLPLLGSSTSHAGMWDLLVERRPKYVLIDEIEKMPLADMAGLLSLMESGRIIRAKVGRMIEEKLDVRVIAAANRINKLPPELLSRFWKRPLAEYNASEYVQVVESVLAKREGLSASDAHRVAMNLMGRTHDVRDAIRVARLSKRIGVDRALQLFCEQ